MSAKLKNLWCYFSLYEKCWFVSIAVLATVFAFLFPEEDVGGVNGKIIMALYLVDIFSNILCELLISKQSKWNFLVSLVVELTEITICLVLAYRFATMAVTLLFWIPIDIISFIQWNRHPDRQDERLTEVRRLTPAQDILVVTAILVWTVVVGYLLTFIEVDGILSDYPRIERLVCYLDACTSAVGIANGVFILLRYREQWLAWYLVAILETVINILSGQWVLLILKLGYLTNTTYGYIRWTSYIQNRRQDPSLSNVSAPPVK